MKNNGNSFGRLAAPFLMDVVQLQAVVVDIAALPDLTTRFVTPHSYTLCITAVVIKHTLKGAAIIYNYFNKII